MLWIHEAIIIPISAEYFCFIFFYYTKTQNHQTFLNINNNGYPPPAMNKLYLPFFYGKFYEPVFTCVYVACTAITIKVLQKPIKYWGCIKYTKNKHLTTV